MALFASVIIRLSVVGTFFADVNLYGKVSNTKKELVFNLSVINVRFQSSNSL